MSDVNVKPPRRVRYKGKNPTKFNEKYKELNPEKYSEDLEKVKQRGATPVGTHRPICVEEILQILNPKPGETVLDATLGYGGHSSFLLPKIQPNGRLIGLDQDPIERPKTETRLRKLKAELGFSNDNLIIGAINFSESKSFLKQQGINKVDMILADLGISSMQIDDPQRGFSMKFDAPLDLRMNPSIGISAARLIAERSAQQIEEILFENSDESRAAIFAKALHSKRPKTTHELVSVLRDVISGFSKKVQLEHGEISIRRVFQALRIEVNQEFKVLDQFLKDIPTLLNPGGRVAILSFHSGEDRRVKKSFQSFERQKIYSSVAAEFIRPSPVEQIGNTRSKSAKLRWAKL